jgi:hypothetical protein
MINNKFEYRNSNNDQVTRIQLNLRFFAPNSELVTPN